MFERATTLARLFGELRDEEAIQVLADMLDALPIGAALYEVAGEEFRVAYVNREVERQLGTDARNLVGKGAVEAFGPSALDFLEAFRKVGRSGRPWRIPEYAARQSGNRYLIEARPIPDQRQPRYILAWWYDVTQQVAARHRAEAALELALEVGRPLEATEVVRTLMDRAATEAAADRVALARLYGQRLVVEATQGLAEDPSGLVLTGARPALIDEALAAGRPRAGPLQATAGAEALLRIFPDGIEAAAVPLLLEQSPAALLLLARRQGPGFAEEELALLELIASHAALALHNAGIADRLRLGMDLAVALAAQLDPVAVIRSLLQMTVRAMGGRATLSRVTGEELIVVDSYSEELPVFPVGTRWRREDYPLMNAALASGLPQTGDENRDPRFFPPEIEMMAVPLHLGGLPFAAVGLSRKHVPFTSEDLLTLKLVGTLAALALRNADLFEELRETSRTKTHLMNLVAHELRGPLSVISAYLAMLQAGPVAPDSATVGVLLGKVDESNELVDRLLLAARLEAGARLSASLEEVDLRTVLEGARSRALARARISDADLSLRLPQDAARLVTDPEQVGRILDNLLANAIAYSGQRPRVVIELGLGPGQAEILVRDSGRGIPAASWESVFQQFVRLNESGPPGTGLGLYISRRLAEGLGGRLEVAESRPGQGSTFRLTLPRA